MAVVPVHCSRDVTLARSNKGEPPMLDLQCDPQFGHGASPCTMRTTVYVATPQHVMKFFAVLCRLCSAVQCGAVLAVCALCSSAMRRQNLLGEFTNI